MGKWIALLEEKSSIPSPPPLTKLTEVPCVSSVSTGPGGIVVSQVQSPTSAQRPVCRLDRLLRWGWDEDRAAALAARLDARAADDSRVVCVECSSYRPGRCVTHRAAGLQRPEVGRDLAGMLQNCPAFEPEGGGA